MRARNKLLGLVATGTLATMPPVAPTTARRLRPLLLTLVLAATFVVGAQSAANAESTCGITRQGIWGWYYCSYPVRDTTYQGRQYTFVVGGGHDVWYIRSGYSSWKSIGGTASQNRLDVAVYEQFSEMDVTINEFNVGERCNFSFDGHSWGGWVVSC